MPVYWYTGILSLGLAQILVFVAWREHSGNTSVLQEGGRESEEGILAAVIDIFLPVPTTPWIQGKFRKNFHKCFFKVSLLSLLLRSNQGL
jgi:hypothetical protein